MFGQRLFTARKAKNLTLEQLAQIYNKRFGGGLSRGTLSKYENEKQEPMISTVGHLASILEVSVDHLINGDENNSKPKKSLFTDINKKAMEKNSEEDIDLLKLNYNKLNILGKQKADEYVADLAENPKYTETTPKVVGITTPNITADIPQQPKKNNTQESAPSLSDSGNIAAFGAEETRPAKLKKANTTL